MTCMWNLKYDISECLCNRSRVTDPERLVVAKGEQGGDRHGARAWDQKMQAILYTIGWISSKVLLQSTENHIQSPVINHDGKNTQKRMSM